MNKCLIVQPIHPAGPELLSRAGLVPVLATAPDAMTVLHEVTDAVAVITRNAGLSADAIAAAPLLRVIAVHGIGTDPVAVDAATRRRIVVVNTPEANVRSVAEQALALTLALAKASIAADAAVRRGDFSFKYVAPLVELAGRSFGVVGFGNIGRATAGLAKAFGMRVLGYSRSQPNSSFAAAGVDRCADLNELLTASDVVSLHLPLTSGTCGIIGAAELALMRPGAFLINTARGGLVDEGALAAALTEGHLGGAGLDVFSEEPLPRDAALFAAPNVVFSPHVAGSTAQALERTARVAAEQVIAVLAGQRPPHLVNPDVWSH